MVESICVGCLGSGPLFDNKSVDEIKQQIDSTYWQCEIKHERLW